MARPHLVIPAKAGIPGRHDQQFAARPWTPAFAGVTEDNGSACTLVYLGPLLR